MKLDIKAGNKNDEYYTPSYAVTPIIPYLRQKQFKKIWCPFDTQESNFVTTLKNSDFEVTNTHISNQEDFFKLNIDCDVIVSNPPYSKKTEVLDRLFDLNKPFAMLVGLSGLFESQKRFKMFSENDFEIMYFNLRVSYLNTFYEVCPSINPPFPSVYITSKLLPKKIVFEMINKKGLINSL